MQFQENFEWGNFMADLKFEIRQHIACLSEERGGWTKELNLISWNGREPKYDIRSWSEGHAKMGKGMTLSQEEIATLKEVLNELI